MANLTVLDVLEGGLAALDEKGWTKGRLNERNGACCSLGALYYGVQVDRKVAGKKVYSPATMSNRISNKRRQIVALATRRLEDHVGGWSIVSWNDKKASSANEVKAIFKKAIKAEKARMRDEKKAAKAAAKAAA